jgi:hypothetical protein
MHRMSLNTAIMSFAFAGILAPHRHPDEARVMSPQGSGRSAEWKNSGEREDRETAPFGSPRQLTTAGAANPGSVWIGALNR